MISLSVTNFLKSHLGGLYRFYRLFFNLVSVITLIPVLWYSDTVITQPVFRWEGVLIIIQIMFVGLSIYLFYAGGKHYDALQFLGIRQIKSKNLHTILSQSGELDNKEIMCITRHPWYLGAILIIWARNLDFKTIIVNCILTGYLIVGTILEEKKLVAEFGYQYRGYQKKVSMLFPFKWLLQRMKK